MCIICVTDVRKSLQNNLFIMFGLAMSLKNIWFNIFNIFKIVKAHFAFQSQLQSVWRFGRGLNVLLQEM